MSTEEVPPQRSRPRALALPGIIFLILLGVHGWAVHVGWSSELLQGHEFRQTQTALATWFIQRDHDFSLAYPTPVLGKPWSVPMEFPLYQWTVAWLSTATHTPLIPAARAVSYAWFLLCLPAIWLILRQLSLPPGPRFIILSILLTSPLYIFYTRTFLMETMALGFSLWFLCAYVAAVRHHHFGWLLLANLAGAGAGLVKVTTWMIYLLPAAGFSAYVLWQIAVARPVSDSPRGRPFVVALAWMAAGVTLPLVATLEWMHFADTHKALNVSAAYLASESLTSYHFGTFADRFDLHRWQAWWRTTTTHLTPSAGLAVFAVAWIGSPARWRRWSLLALALYLAAPLTFPILYSVHEYYFTANAALLLIAVGLATAGWLETDRPRWLVWPLLLVVPALQLGSFFRNFYPAQCIVHEGGTSVTRLLRDATAPNDVVIVAGDDWNSRIPFFSHRRALMIRNNREQDTVYLGRAFADLHDESVTALVLIGAQRENAVLLDHACRAFALDPAPFATWQDQTLYVSREQRLTLARRVANLAYDDLQFSRPSERLTTTDTQPVTAGVERFFPNLSPTPVRYQVPFGLGLRHLPDGARCLDAHATTRLWFVPPPRSHQISLRFGLIYEAYVNEPSHTDGVDFSITLLLVDGSKQKIFTRFLNPYELPADRGPQQAEVALPALPIAEILFETGPGPSGSRSCDWAYLERFELR